MTTKLEANEPPFKVEAQESDPLASKRDKQTNANINTNPHFNTNSNNNDNHNDNDIDNNVDDDDDNHNKFGKHIIVKAARASGSFSAVYADHIQLSDFVGHHGAYQFSITVLLFVRYVLLGLMANSGPLMTPDVTFYCALPRQEILLIMPNISTLSEREQELEIKEEFKQICQIDLHLYKNVSQLNNATTRSQARTTSSIVVAGQQQDHQQQHQHQHQQHQQKQQQLNSQQAANSTTPEMGRIRECTDFTYQLAQDQGLTMTSEFDLVCERDWLRSLFQSLLSASIVVAHVFWGTFSDKYGRFQAQRICLVISLFAGLFSIFALDFWTFTLARALCSFGDLGMVVSQTTTVVELVGSKYRGLSVALVNFGYALGVSLLPYVVAYFENFRAVVAFTLLCHMVTMPFVLATNESVRWLLTNRKFEQARKELRRIARANQSWQSFWRSFLPRASEAQRDSKKLDQPKEAIQTKSTEKASSRASQRRKQRRRRQNEAYELMFKEFVRQIESQNLCDPTTSRPPPSAHSTGAAQAASARRRLQVPEISIVVEGADSRAAPPSQSPLLGASAKADRTTPSSDSASNRSLELSSSPTGSGRPRAQSCGQISDGAPAASQLVFAGASFDDWPTRGRLEAKLKTLTLPLPVSRDSSTCGEELDELDEDEDTYTISQRLARGRSHAARPQPDCINLVTHQLSFVGRVSRLFKDKRLMIAVFTIVYTTFNSELLYTSFIIINLEVGEDVYLNYILGGCMEALAAIMASLLLSYAPRRLSLIAFWLLISVSSFGLALAHIDSTWAVWMLALAKFSQSCLSSIASVAAYESFPTFLRQSGSGLVFTLGMLGSVFAPLIFAEFDDHAGMDRVLMTFSFSSLTAAILIYLFLNETRDCELM